MLIRDQFVQQAKCRTCAMISSLLNNPYQYSGQVIAKLGVNIATIIWAVVVLWKDAALSLWPGPQWLQGVVGENFAAALLLILAVIATGRLLFKSVPLMIGACVYGVFLLLWLYTWTTLVIAIHDGLTALRPGQLAGVTLVTALAVFAFVSNPKRSAKNDAAD